jgi:BirA family transcriptional regulator, biotin operon repressor / biotin---[acetyl-CoA-carboxylase] ligase
MFTGMAGDGASYEPGGRGAWVEVVRTAVAGTRFADVRWCAETGSTNADVLDLARNGAGEGIVLVADYQRAGRGRRARSWVAPPGGSLLVSVLLRPPAPVAGAATMTAAVALAEAVEEVTGVAAGLKWPNDLVVDDRKLAGILAEADWPAGANISAGWREPPAHARVPVVVGTGVNVAWPPVLPPELEEVADTATALSRLVDGVAEGPGGADDLRGRVLAAYLRRLDRRYGELVSDGSAGILAAWRQRSATLGRRVRVDLGPDDVEGTAVDVTDEGHLVVQSLTGERRALAVGDVVHLRPAEGGPRTP